MIRIVICDDDAVITKKYETRINELAKKHSLDISIRIFMNAEQLLFYMEDEAPFVDLIFQDICMPGMDGVEAAALLRERGYNGEIVFLTNQYDRAIDGYDVQAFHFIVKERASDEEFERIFLSVADQIQNMTTEYITFQGIGESRNIPIKDIGYFSINRRIITVHYGNETFDFYSSMEKVEATMLEYGFLRLQRSYLVNIDYINDFTSESVTLKDGSKVSLSRKTGKQMLEIIRNKGASRNA